jgi:hypothetical protein
MKMVEMRVAKISLFDPIQIIRDTLGVEGGLAKYHMGGRVVGKNITWQFVFLPVLTCLKDQSPI